jgi:hypothetical protein
MANDKFYGFKPKYNKTPEAVAELDRLNPYEFRKGMDYELTKLGCLRLHESTPDEREKATETVLKNLKEHQSYYSALIQFEGGMDLGKKITESSFKKYLETYNPGDPGTGMIEVSKDDKESKMVEPKYNKKDYTISLKEAIKNEISNILNEKKGDDDDDDKSEKKASKGAKGKEKALKALDKEVEKLNNERAKNKEKLSAPLQKYKDGKLTADEYRKLSNDTVKRNKEIIARLGEIEKEKNAITLNEKMGRREVAKTMMEKDTHMEILNIIKEAGISLKEGAAGVKVYYEIAKIAYQEGFMAGLHRN